GAEELRDLGLHRAWRVGDTVDDRVGETGERHRGRIDRLVLRIPFVRDGLRQRWAGGREGAPCRRPHRPSVEQNGVAATLWFYRHGLVETAPQLRGYVAAGRLGRIERLLLKHIVEDIAHPEGLSAARPSGQHPLYFSALEQNPGSFHQALVMAAAPLWPRCIA